ncbi:MAG: hypothetical protein IPL77_00150 [Flavobacteriales bacterium]|nr:hypothetical protein [Flavobacteriales bacterium]
MVLVHGPAKGSRSEQLENARRAGALMAERLTAAKRTEAQLIGLHDDIELLLALAEGFALGAYNYRKFKTSKAPTTLERLTVVHPEVDRKTLERPVYLVEVVCTVRPGERSISSLNAVQLASEFRTLCRNAGEIQVLEKGRIEALGMGGLLAGNKGSIDPPTFSILEYKPKKVVNAKPIVLVGKGVVYDTGGLSLKPTPNSMDYMKCDMAGGACVAGAIAAAALLSCPCMWSPSCPPRTTGPEATLSHRAMWCACTAA